MNVIKKPAFVFIIIFILALIPRVYELNKTIIYPDEITWTVRGKELIFAFKQQNWSYFNSVWWNSKKENESIALPTTFLSGLFTALFGQGQSSISLNLLPGITAARIPLAVLNALLAPIFYLMAKRLTSHKAALIASLLLLLDPVHLALSRWVMLDALLTLFTFSSILLFILSLNNKKFIPLTGLILSLGFLTKPLGILPIAAWGFLSLTYNHKFKNNFKVLSLIMVFFFFYTWILLPGSWHKPIFAIFEYLWQQQSLGQEGYAIFFMGEVTTQPPFYFYLFQIFSRIPSLIVIGSIVSVFLIIQKLIPLRIAILRKYSIALSLAIFFIFFFLVISLTPLKLGARYALPLWPGIYLLAAFMLDYLFEKIKSKQISLVLILIPIFTSLWTLKTYFPDNYFFYNSLIGGPSNAQKYDLVGHCLGTKPALEFVDSCYPRSKSVTVLGCSAITTPYYFSRPILSRPSSSNITVVEYTYKQLLSNPQTLHNLSQQKLIYTTKLNGAILAEVYSKDDPALPSCLQK